MSDVGHRRDNPHRFAAVLSPDTWQYSVILLFALPAENHHSTLSSFPVTSVILWLTLRTVVLLRRSDSELLVVGAIRP